MEQEKKRLANDLIDVEVALGHVYPEVETTHEEKDLLLYALGVGAGADLRDLRYVYENHKDFGALPTFVVSPALAVALANELQGKNAPGLSYGFDRILHAWQLTEVRRPLPRAGKLKHQAKVKAIYDKAKYAVVVIEVRTRDEGGEELAYNEFTLTVRGAGNFGGEPGPSLEVNLPPPRPPDAVVEQKIREDQALLYRLSGDRNPLHVDPEFAEKFGLPKPILHGLCTYGFATRHVLRAFAKDDPKNFKGIRVKFAATVFPGETLVTEMWRESDARIVFQSRVKERDKVVLSNAAVELAPGTAAAVVAAPASSAPGALLLQKLELSPALVAQVGAVVQLRLQDPASDWVLDLKNGSGAVRKGIAADAELALAMADAAVVEWSKGADVKDLLSQGRAKLVAGEGRVVAKLGAVTRALAKAGAGGH